MSASARLKQINSVHSEPFDLLNLYPLLDTVQVSSNEEDHGLQLLELGINQVTTDPNRYQSFPCAVCNGAGHSFQDCPYLQNTPKVREAYGKLCAYLNRCCNVAAKLNKSLGELKETPVQQLQLHALMAASSSSVADVSALTTPTAVKSLAASPATHATLPLEADDASTDDSSCGQSLDFP